MSREAIKGVKPEVSLIKSPDAARRLPLLGLCIFLAVLYLRPSDLIPALAYFRPALVILILTLVVLALNKLEIVLLAYTTSRLLLCFLVVMVLSIPFSYWPGASFTTTINYIKEVTVFLLIVNVASSLEGLSRIIGVIIGSNLILALFAVKDYITGNLSGGGRIEGVVGGIFEDPNDLAVSFVSVVPLIYWKFRTSTTTLSRLLSLGAILLVLSGVVATQSRGGFIGLLFVAVVLIRGSRQKVVAAILALALGLGLVLVNPQGAFERFGTIVNYDKEETAQIRLAMWRAGLRMFADHPVLGVGAGVFGTAYGKEYRDPKFPYGTWWTAHNSVIQVMAELGLAGLCLWIGLVVSGFLILRKARRWLSSVDQDSVFFEALELNSALSVSFVGFLVSSLFLSKAYDWILIILLAMITASLRMTEGRSLESAGEVGPRFAGGRLRPSGQDSLRKGIDPSKERVL